MRNKLRILGHDYTVKHREALNAYGKTSLADGKMFIAPDMTRAQQISTIIHEAIELIGMQLELTLEHRVVCSMETGIYQFLVENGVDLTPLLECIDEE